MKTFEGIALGLVTALCAAALVGGFFVALWPLYERLRARRSSPPDGVNSQSDEEV